MRSERKVGACAGADGMIRWLRVGGEIPGASVTDSSGKGGYRLGMRGVGLEVERTWKNG